MKSLKLSLLQTRLLLMLSLCLILLTGCFRIGKTEVQYARATKSPEELTGQMRLAQDKVKVQVIGQQNIGDFNAKEPSKEYKNLAAYIVMHEQDAASFIRNTKKLQELLGDSEIKELAKKKGLLP